MIPQLPISTADLIDLIENSEDQELWLRSIMAKQFAAAIKRDLAAGAIVQIGEHIRKAGHTKRLSQI